MRIQLKRQVKQRHRYYKLEMQKSLFGDFLLVIYYGSFQNATFTRKYFLKFKSFEELKYKFNLIVTSKLKKGYRSY
ncbi:WGR domain-containing protein [Arcobacter sp.]|uniref:WGR domain-containing protein n=1 Tax=Arcobacter sp. TaxID=1872629 RepID=UPI003D0153CF